MSLNALDMFCWHYFLEHVFQSFIHLFLFHPSAFNKFFTLSISLSVWIVPPVFKSRYHFRTSLRVLKALTIIGMLCLSGYRWSISEYLKPSKTRSSSFRNFII